MRKRIMTLANSLAADGRVIDRDLKNEYNFDSTALMVLGNLEDRVSIQIYDMIRDMLLGFEDGMQLEIADNLLDFTVKHVIHTTGCPSADYILEACYRWIAEEQGILDSHSFAEIEEEIS
jgi:hypothetical protein